MSIVSFSSSMNNPQRNDAGVSGARTSSLEFAAEQFEALFLQQVLKQMRKAGDVLSADNPMRSRELDTMRDFYDGMLAETLASKRQTGIADMLVQQLSGNRDQLAAIDEAAVSARGADLPQRSMSLSDPLRQTWQRGTETVSSVWQRGFANFRSLVNSIIQHESGGRVDAVSPKGALGVMQLMPDTAKDMAVELGLAFSESRLTRDAGYNTQLGSAYLKKMLDRYDGEQTLAVAAYNAGPGRVDEWLQRNGDPRNGNISVSNWIERIPFRETRDYARKIFNDMQAAAPAAPAPTTTAALTSVKFNTSADSVALQENTSHQSRSAAFARQIRIDQTENGL